MTASTRHRVLKDRRTKNLIPRLRAGDIALIAHADLDTTAARGLIEARVAAVVNALPSVSGRYPNRGPGVLLAAGIPLLDALGEAAFEAIADGQEVSLLDDALRLPDGSCHAATRLTPELLQAQILAAQNNLSSEMDHFARNTLDFIAAEKTLLFDPIDVPALKTRFDGKHVLIVVRGEGYKEDLAMLRDYLRDVRPILLAVDGGADALLEYRMRPTMILGDMDSVSDAALKCGAELVVHGYAKGERHAPGRERIEQLGLTAATFHSHGTSEDAAMLLADELGAKLIVAVGTHFSLEEFLDKGRAGMASTFLTRLRIGSKLVDAKGIARLWSQHRPRFGEIGLLLFAASTPIVAVLLLAPMGKNLLRVLTLWFRLHLHR